MIKKILIIIIVLTGIYFIIGGTLKVSKLCPKYIDFMPKIGGQDFSKIWYIFCPFSEKIY